MSHMKLFSNIPSYLVKGKIHSSLSLSLSDSNSRLHREITMNGRPVHLSKKLNMKTDFDYPWDVPGHLMRVSIKETVDRFVYSLFIDNVPFRHLPHNSEVPTSGSKKSSKKSKKTSSSSSSWDPFAEAGVDTEKTSSSSKKKKKKKKKKVKKQESTSDWVDFGDDSSSTTTQRKKKESAGDLLADVFSSSTTISDATTPSTTTDDLFSSNTDTTSASLSDLSSLYASSGSTTVQTTTTTTAPKTTNTIQHASVKKVDSWGGLVDLNGISAQQQQQQQVPMAPSTNIAMNAFNNYNMSRVPTNYMSPAQPSNGMMMGGGRGYNQSPGMLPPRSMQFQNTTPTQNPRAMSNHRKQAAQSTSTASAFEADPFARFN